MNNYLNLQDLKEKASLVELLAKLGFHPAKKSRNSHIYHSMLRDNDTVPSFNVNDELGVWFDHGTGKGGNIIDFGLAYWKHLSFSEVVEKIKEVCAIAIELKPSQGRPRRPVRIPHYIVEKTEAIGTHPAITDYLKSRGIFEIAGTLLNEVYYYVEDPKGIRKHFFAAGWKNENGSWEVRNKYFKGCLGNKGISFIQGHKKNLAVFEGYMNYLSWKLENPAAQQSALILNSLALLNAGLAKAREFSSIDLFLDRDSPGFTATQEFIGALPYATDRSSAYRDYNDYNDKLVASIKQMLVNDREEIGPKSSISM
jgi:hypothetical protein